MLPDTTSTVRKNTDERQNINKERKYRQNVNKEHRYRQNVKRSMSDAWERRIGRYLFTNNIPQKETHLKILLRQT